MSETMNPVTANVARQIAEIIIECIRSEKALASPWMDETQAAAYLGFKPRGLQGYRRKGGGPKWYMPGGLIRYHRDDLDAYMLAAPKTEPGK